MFLGERCLKSSFWTKKWRIYLS